MQAESKPAASHLTLQILGGLLLVYLFFPIVLLWPFFRLYPGMASVPRGLKVTLDVIFWPITKLDDKVPAYHSLIQAECNWLGIR